MADNTLDLNSILNQVINAGTGALGGYVQGSDMSPWLKGIIGTAMTSPSGTPPFQSGYLPGAQEEYAYKLANWAARKQAEQERIGQTQATQRDRMLALLGQVRPQLQQLYQPTAQEQALQQQGTMLRDVLQGMYTQQTPAYKERLDRLERERVAKTQQDLQDLVAQHERAVARGGVGLLTPERRDEMIARTMAKTQDTARDQANERVMSDLVKVFSGGVTSLAPMSQLSQLERARQTTGLQADIATQMQQAQAQGAYENLMSDLAGKYEATQPDPFAIKQKYFWSGVPGGTGTVGSGANNSILGQLVGAGVSGLGDILSGAGSAVSSGLGSMSDWIKSLGGSSTTNNSILGDTSTQTGDLSNVDWGNFDWNSLNYGF